MGALQKPPALVERKDRDGPLQTENLGHLLFGDGADVPQPFPHAPAARIFLRFQSLFELLIIHQTARKHQQSEGNTVSLGRRLRRSGKELPDSGSEGLFKALGAAIPVPSRAYPCTGSSQARHNRRRWDRQGIHIFV